MSVQATPNQVKGTGNVKADFHSLLAYNGLAGPSGTAATAEEETVNSGQTCPLPLEMWCAV